MTWHASASHADWLALRAHDITSTEISALFHLSPYDTAFTLWHKKHGNIPSEITETPRMSWGKRLQDAIAAGICADQGWKHYYRQDDYARHAEEPRMGASFDFFASRDGVLGILEVKNVDSLQFKRSGWDVDPDSGELTAPEHIELQLQHQMEVADMPWGAIGVLVGGNTPYCLIRDRDRAVGQACRAAVRRFWTMAEPPSPDYAADGDAIRALRVLSGGGSADMSGNNRLIDALARYRAAGDVSRQAETDRKAASAEILDIIGEHDKVKAGEWRISAGTVGESHVEYTRKAYRNLRVTGG